MMRSRPFLAPAQAALAASLTTLAAGTASATWSIIIINTRTGEIGVASATCLTGFNLRDNTPVLIPGVGAATAQSFVDSSGQNRVKIRDMLIERAHPDDILAALALFDSGHQTRQYGIADTLARAATFSGTGAGAWAGGQIGQLTQTGNLGDLVYAVQGNVLTGEPVVTEAVQAIIDTPGDIAAKLMASMEAARAMGGDGRCSCPGPGGPTACGAPPATFNKSAHIAYMLIARAGDRPGCNGLYNAGVRPFDTAVADLNGDGALDIVSCSGATTSVLINRHQPGDAFVTLSPAVFHPSGNDTRGVALADVNGDGILDLISAGFAVDLLGVQLGNGDGTFGTISALAAGDGPRLIATGDFNGDGRIDVACTNQNSSDVSIFLNTGTALGTQTRRSVGTAPAVIHAGDIDGDGDLDLATLSSGTARVTFLINNGAGAFTLGPLVLVGANPTDMRLADFDGDGDLDAITTDRDANALSVLRNSGTGSFTRTTAPAPAAPTRLGAADLDADGLLDLLVTSGGANTATLYKGDGAGGYTPASTFSVNDGFLDLELADLSGDGLPDIVGAASGSRSIIIIEQFDPGAFNSGIGCATGDYYMNFNVANTVASDPEPVYTLLAMYNAWRSSLIGRTDAVLSTVSFDAPAMPEGGLVRMTISLRDWQANPVTLLPAELLVEHADDSAALCTIGPVEPLGAGLYAVTLAGPVSGLGADSFRITAFDDARPVVLMPETSISVAPSPADFDGDGTIDIIDFLEFFDAYGAGRTEADVTGDGNVDELDAAFFIASFTV